MKMLFIFIDMQINNSLTIRITIHQQQKYKKIIKKEIIF